MTWPASRARPARSDRWKNLYRIRLREDRIKQEELRIKMLQGTSELDEVSDDNVRPGQAAQPGQSSIPLVAPSSAFTYNF